MCIKRKHAFGALTYFFQYVSVSTCALIMNADDGILVTHLNARTDDTVDFLLHFGIYGRAGQDSDKLVLATSSRPRAQVIRPHLAPTYLRAAPR